LQLALNDIPGLNLNKGTFAFNGNINKLVNLLNLFSNHHRQDIDLLRNYLNNQRRDEALRLAHTLKGVGGSLGIDNLQLRAQQLETALKNQAEASEVSGLIDALEMILLPLLAGIHKLSEQQHADGLETGINSEKLKEILQTLESLLLQDDTRANSLWLESSNFLKTAVGLRALALGNAIESYEYNKALPILRQMLSSIT
jgi:HPt (histidine-containing phosphotransfer) domain-containing protein